MWSLNEIIYQVTIIWPAYTDASYRIVIIDSWQDNTFIAIYSYFSCVSKIYMISNAHFTTVGQTMLDFIVRYVCRC